MTYKHQTEPAGPIPPAPVVPPVQTPIPLQTGPSVTQADQAKEVIEQAAKLIKERGWTRARLRDSNGKVCVVGAIIIAAVQNLGLNENEWISEDGHIILRTGTITDYTKAQRLVDTATTLIAQHISPNVYENEETVWQWNDAQTFRGKRKVIRELQAVANNL